MAPVLSEFDRYKLNANFTGDCCEHTIDGVRGMRIERWRKDVILGQGGFGMVWLEREGGGKLRAVKQIPKRPGNAYHAMKLRELRALTELNKFPQSFVQFLGWFEDKQSVYFAMEYIEFGDLAGFILGFEGNIAEQTARVIAMQLLEGLKIMHENGFCHRDLKPQNILMASKSPLVVKISDFGLTKQVVDDTVLQTGLGTVEYMAPEILSFISSDSSGYTNAVDLWSLGCLVYAIMTKKTPFPGGAGLYDYARGQTSFPQESLVGRNASTAAIRFISSLVMVHPQKRLTAAQAIDDPWITDDREAEREEVRVSSSLQLVEALAGVTMTPGLTQGPTLPNTPDTLSRRDVYSSSSQPPAVGGSTSIQIPSLDSLPISGITPQGVDKFQALDIGNISEESEDSDEELADENLHYNIAPDTEPVQLTHIESSEQQQCLEEMQLYCIEAAFDFYQRHKLHLDTINDNYSRPICRTARNEPISSPTDLSLGYWTHILRRISDARGLQREMVSKIESFNGDASPVNEIQHARKKQKVKSDRDLLALIQLARKFCWQLKNWDKCQYLDDLYGVMEKKIRHSKLRHSKQSPRRPRKNSQIL